MFEKFSDVMFRVGTSASRNFIPSPNFQLAAENSTWNFSSQKTDRNFQPVFGAEILSQKFQLGNF